jgi:hypothetical protein
VDRLRSEIRLPIDVSSSHVVDNAALDARRRERAPSVIARGPNLRSNPLDNTEGATILVGLHATPLQRTRALRFVMPGGNAEAAGVFFRIA